MYQTTFTPEYVETVQSRVQKGVEWLEKKKGPRWFDAIDLPTLRLASPYMCILGQTFKDEAQRSRYDDNSGFFYARTKFKLPNEGVDHGFNTKDDVMWNDLPLSERKNANNPWTLLGELWIGAIRKARRAAGKKVKK